MSCLPRRDYYYYNYRADADADDGASSFRVVAVASNSLSLFYSEDEF